MDYYSAIKGNKTTNTSNILDKSQNVMWSKRNQIQRRSYCMVPFIQYSGKEKIKRDRECGFQLTRVLTTKGQDEKVLQLYWLHNDICLSEFRNTELYP